VLFETAPEVYRTADLEHGEFFRLYSEAQGGSFDNLRLKIASFADLRDPRAVRTGYDETTTLRLGKIELIKGNVEQSGVLGTVSSSNVFTTVRGRFSFSDVGKELTVRGSSIVTNNVSVVVTNVVSSTELLTNPVLSPDTGSLRWELRELEASTQFETLVEVLAGDVEVITPGWILTDGFAEFTVLKRQQFKAADDERKFLTLREGVDGSINASLRFVSASIELTSSDVGRRLTLANTVYPDTNSGKFEIVDVVSATECILDSTDLQMESTGLLVWAVLREPELTLQGSATLRGYVEQSGDDGEVATATRFVSDSGEFSSTDANKLLTIHKPGNADNGTYEVTSVISSTELELDATLTTAVTSDFHWELRSATDIGDETQVQVRAPSLIGFLAQDFGIEIDTREEEEWQRRWVESVPRWIGLKGHEDGYKCLAELTGFTASVTALYRVTQEIYESMVAAGETAHAIGEDGDGRSGLDGSLNVVGSAVRFSSPTVLFENWDIGRQVYVSGTFGGTNDGLRTIFDVVDSQTVEFRVVDSMTGSSDGNNGSIEWSVVRLYSDLAPMLPVYDEINSSLMTYLKTIAVFVVDKYCWEQSPSPWSTLLGPGDSGDGRIFITGVDPAVPSVFAIAYTVTGRGDFEVVSGVGVGFWKITDSGAVEHFLQTVPTLKEQQSGSDGSLSATPRLSSSSGTFTTADIGRVVVVDGAVAPVNNKAFLITGVGSGYLDLSVSQVAVIDPNNSNLSWKVLDPDATGTDGSLTAPRRFSSASAPFVATDEGKRLYVSESGSGNNRMYVIETYVDASNVDLAPYNSPTTPDANNGSLVWGMFSYEFQVVATSPPAVGVASLEYVCSEVLMCSFCKSNRILVEASTPYLLEAGFERLGDRLDHVTPAHVERIDSFGFEIGVGLNLTVTVDSP